MELRVNFFMVLIIASLIINETTARAFQDDEDFYGGDYSEEEEDYIDYGFSKRGAVKEPHPYNPETETTTRSFEIIFVHFLDRTTLFCFVFQGYRFTRHCQRDIKQYQRQ